MNNNQSRLFKIAQVVSALFSPYLVAVATIVVVSFSATGRMLLSLLWTLVSVGIVIVPSFLYVLYQVRKGNITDLHVRERPQRHRVYFVGLAMVILVLLILWYFDAPLQLLALFLTVMIVNLICFGINTRWKISLHAATMGVTTVAFFLLIGTAVGLITTVLSLLVMWGRVTTKSHTFAQTVAGYLLAAIILYAIYAAFGLA